MPGMQKSAISFFTIKKDMYKIPAPCLWRDGRVAEGAPLLREYEANTSSRVRIPLSPPEKLTRAFSKKHGTLSCHCAPVAQLDRVPGYELGGRRFESFRARHFFLMSLFSF